eukprot:839971_1
MGKKSKRRPGRQSNRCSITDTDNSSPANMTPAGLSSTITLGEEAFVSMMLNGNDYNGMRKYEKELISRAEDCLLTGFAAEYVMVYINLGNTFNHLIGGAGAGARNEDTGSGEETINQVDNRKAEIYYKKALSCSEKDKGLERLQYKSFGQLFYLYVSSGKVDEAGCLYASMREVGRELKYFDMIYPLAVDICNNIVALRKNLIASDQPESGQLIPSLAAPGNLFTEKCTNLVLILEDHIDMIEASPETEPQALYNFYEILTSFYDWKSDVIKAVKFAKRHNILAKESGNKSEEFEALQRLAGYFEKMGKYEEAIRHMESCKVIFMDLMGGGNGDNESSELLVDPETHYFNLYQKGAFFRRMGHMYILMSRTRKGAMKKISKKEAIKMYLKAIAFFSEARCLGIENSRLSIIYLAITNRTLGRVFANEKKWDKAHEYMSQSIGVDQNGNVNKESEDIAMSFQYWGQVYLDQYYHQIGKTGGEEATKEMPISGLQKALELSSKAVAMSKNNENGVSSRALLDVAQELYLLGHFDQSFSKLCLYLDQEIMSSSRYCQGCNQVGNFNVVSRVCKGCNACYYCNELCQHLDWKWIEDKRKSHKMLCPLLKHWRKSWKEMLLSRVQTPNMVEDGEDPQFNQHSARPGILLDCARWDKIKQTEKGQFFSGIFTEFFESLRKC